MLEATQDFLIHTDPLVRETTGVQQEPLWHVQDQAATGTQLCSNSSLHLRHATKRHGPKKTAAKPFWWFLESEDSVLYIYIYHVYIIYIYMICIVYIYIYLLLLLFIIILMICMYIHNIPTNVWNDLSMFFPGKIWIHQHQWATRHPNWKKALDSHRDSHERFKNPCSLCHKWEKGF